MVGRLPRGLGLFVLLAFALAVCPVQADEPPSEPLPYTPDIIPLSQYTSATASPQGLISQLKKPQEYYLAIYSSNPSGVYFKVASTLCDIMRMHFDQHHIHCVVLRSGGAGDNIRRMREGRVQMAITQSSLTYLASTGKNPIPGARSVMSLHDEISVLVTRAKAKIGSAEDLRNKRINLGGEESVGHGLFVAYLGASGISQKDLNRTDSFPIEYGPQGICGNYIDAYPILTGHPSQVVTDAITRCGAKVLGLNGPGMDELLRHHPEFSHFVLPAGTYPGQDEPLESIGAKAVVVAYQPASPHVVYWLVKSAVENIALLRASSPALSRLTPQEMFTTGNFLPFHPGAERYWAEIGLLNPPQH